MKNKRPKGRVFKADFPDEDFNALEKLAEESGQTKVAVMRRAIKALVEIDKRSKAGQKLFFREEGPPPQWTELVLL